MNNKLDNMDDLLDDNIGKSLRHLRETFPKTATDFKKMDEIAKQNRKSIPERLKDPSSFLGKKVFKRDSSFQQGERDQDYDNKMAQAAREGKNISDEIREKMAQDKLKSGQNKKDE